MTPDYSMMQELLRSSMPDCTPAMLHGVIAGLLSSGAPDIDEEDIASLMQQSFAPVIGQLVSRLISSTRSQLQELDYSFQLVLPQDEAALIDRVNALGHWCESFTAGFSAGFVQAESVLGEEGREALTDIAQLADLGDEVSDDLDDEEADYMELVEYVRLATVTLFQLLAVTSADSVAEEASPFMAPDDEQLLH
jgi:uncharacterized protein